MSYLPLIQQNMFWHIYATIWAFVKFGLFDYSCACTMLAYLKINKYCLARDLLKCQILIMAPGHVEFDIPDLRGDQNIAALFLCSSMSLVWLLWSAWSSCLFFVITYFFFCQRALWNCHLHLNAFSPHSLLVYFNVNLNLFRQLWAAFWWNWMEITVWN